MYVYVHEKSVALFEQPLSWACVFSSEGRGMYTYLTNGARRHSRWLRRRHDGIPHQREPHPPEKCREKALSGAPARHRHPSLPMRSPGATRPGSVARFSCARVKADPPSSESAAATEHRTI